MKWSNALDFTEGRHDFYKPMKEEVRCQKGHLVMRFTHTCGCGTDANLADAILTCPECGDEVYWHNTNYPTWETRLVMFQGRSTGRIYQDAKKAIEDGVYNEVILITREDSKKSIPDELVGTEVTVEEFEFKKNGTYYVVGNGAASQQLIGVMRKLVEAKADFEFWEVQNDGKTKNRLW